MWMLDSWVGTHRVRCILGTTKMGRGRQWRGAPGTDGQAHQGRVLFSLEEMPRSATRAKRWLAATKYSRAVRPIGHPEART
jgi:hypothetical protein